MSNANMPRACQRTSDDKKVLMAPTNRRLVWRSKATVCSVIKDFWSSSSTVPSRATFDAKLPGRHYSARFGPDWSDLAADRS